MVIVDSTVWIDYLRDADTGQTCWLVARQGRDEIGLTDLILCEVLQGFREECKFERIASELRLLPILDSGGTDTGDSLGAEFPYVAGEGDHGTEDD